VTAALSSAATAPPDHPPPAATSLPTGHPTTEILTVTADPVGADAVVLAVRGEVDLSTSPLLENVLLSHLHDSSLHDAPRVIVDLTGVSFFSAAGLTALVNVKHAAAAAGASLCLVARTRVVLLPLTITGLDAVFDIYPALADTPPVPVGDGPDG
jgi:anti-sigma B factor antagonist